MIFRGLNKIDRGDCVYCILSAPPLCGNEQLHVADQQWEMERLHVHRSALFYGQLTDLHVAASLHRHQLTTLTDIDVCACLKTTCYQQQQRPLFVGVPYL